MPRFIIPLAVVLALGSAFLLYGIKHDTRAIEAQVQARERAIDKAVADIAVLKAERAHLTRPERIEPMARALGLGPATGQQLVRTQPGAQTTTGSLPLPGGVNHGVAH